VLAVSRLKLQNDGAAAAAGLSSDHFVDAGDECFVRIACSFSDMASNDGCLYRAIVPIPKGLSTVNQSRAVPQFLNWGYKIISRRSERKIVLLSTPTVDIIIFAFLQTANMFKISFKHNAVVGNIKCPLKYPQSQ
jgi:hypothetical protein